MSTWTNYQSASPMIQTERTRPCFLKEAVRVMQDCQRPEDPGMASILRRAFRRGPEHQLKDEKTIRKQLINKLFYIILYINNNQVESVLNPCWAFPAFFVYYYSQAICIVLNVVVDNVYRVITTLSFMILFCRQPPPDLLTRALVWGLLGVWLTITLNRVVTTLWFMLLLLSFL